MNTSDSSAEPARFARRALDDIPNLLSLLLFLAATAVLFRSVPFALVVTASLGFHELGHAAALAAYGLDFRITFGVVGAWTWSPAPARARLSHLANAIIHLSGPLFSLLLALLALGLQVVWHPNDSHLLTLANFSAQVGFLNLLPIGPFSDGGKLVRRLIASLDGTPRALAVLLPMIVTAIMLVLYALLALPRLKNADPSPYFLGLLLVGLWMGSSLLIETRRREEISSPAPLQLSSPMTPWQVYFLIFFMWDLLVLGLVITAATPFWLAPDLILGSLRNLAAVLQFISHVAL